MKGEEEEEPERKKEKVSDPRPLLALEANQKPPTRQG